MDVSAAEREFRYNSVVLKDPNPAFTVEQVREFYAAIYPEIVSAAIEGPTNSNNKLVYTFARAVGTKGSRDAKLIARARAKIDKEITGNVLADAKQRHNASLYNALDRLCDPLHYYTEDLLGPDATGLPMVA